MQGRVGEFEIQAIDYEQPALEAALSTLCCSATQRPRGGAWLGPAEAAGIEVDAPSEYRALLRGPYVASYMGLRHIPPHPVRPCGPDCGRTAESSRTGATTAMTGKLFRPPRPTVLATSAGKVLHQSGIRSRGADHCAARARAPSECADACCRSDWPAIAGSSVYLCMVPGRSRGVHWLRPRAALLR